MVGENPMLFQWNIQVNNEIQLPVCKSYGFHWVSVVIVQCFRLVSSKTRKNFEFWYRKSQLEISLWVCDEEDAHLLILLFYLTYFFPYEILQFNYILGYMRIKQKFILTCFNKVQQQIFGFLSLHVERVDFSNRWRQLN